MFDLTEKETLALIYLTQSCLNGMGGSRPIDLDNDPFTWVDVNDLVMEGYTLAQARGLFSSLAEKGVIYEYEKNQMVLADAAYRFADTIWDGYQLSQKKFMIHG